MFLPSHLEMADKWRGPSDSPSLSQPQEEGAGGYFGFGGISSLVSGVSGALETAGSKVCIIEKIIYLFSFSWSNYNFFGGLIESF